MATHDGIRNVNIKYARKKNTKCMLQQKSAGMIRSMCIAANPIRVVNCLSYYIESPFEMYTILEIEPFYPSSPNYIMMFHLVLLFTPFWLHYILSNYI